MKTLFPFLLVLILSLISDKFIILIVISVFCIFTCVTKCWGCFSKFISIYVIFLFYSSLVQNTEFKYCLNSIHTIIFGEFRDTIARNFDNSTAPILLAITTGIKNNYDQNLIKIFKNFNLLYLLHVSGLNFLLLSNLLNPLSKFINKIRRSYIIILIVTLYLLLVGFESLSTVKAFSFCVLQQISTINGRAINFAQKIVIILLLVSFYNKDLITDSGLIISILFSLFYKLLYKKPLKLIFRNNLSKVTATYLFSSLIFNNQTPDIFANIVIAVIYPIIFYSVMLFEFIFRFNLISIASIIKLITENTSDLLIQYLNSLGTGIFIYIQIATFIAILAIIFYKNTRKSLK